MPIIDYAHKAEVCKKRIFNNSEISIKNKDDLKKYLNAIEVKPARVDIICNHLRLLFLEIDDLVGEIDNRELMNETFKKLKDKWSSGYFETLKNVGKAFVRWHNDDETPKGWKDIKRNGKNSQRRDLSPRDMITWEEGLKIIAFSNSIQLKAILMTQLDGGLRPSEFIDLNYGDISREGKYYVAKVDGKTGKRDVILFKCAPYLSKWLSEHPTKKDKDPLWVLEVSANSHSKDKSMRYKYPAVKKRITGLATKADVNKPFDFYNLRHSSAVIKKIDNIPVDVAAMNMGHSVKYFVEVYGRLSIKDITKRMDKAYGMKKEEDSKNNPIECQYCHTSNEPLTDYCVQCGNPLNMNIALKEVQKNKNSEKRLETLEKQLDMLKNLIDLQKETEA